jgi:hypothetical protein
MYLFPITVIDKVARESRSGMADAPVQAYVPPRRFRWFADRRGKPLCEAEARDRSPKIAGAASTC